MSPDQLPTEILPAPRLLTAAEFHRLADVPPEVAVKVRRRGRGEISGDGASGAGT